MTVRHEQDVVEEAVLLVPHADAVVTQLIDRVGDAQEVLPELAGLRLWIDPADHTGRD